jgi:hypothetical protein
LDVEDSPEASPNREAAVAEADLRAYHARKRPMAAWSVTFALAVGLVVATRSPVAAAALVFGTTCGLANAFLMMRGNERLINHQSVASFVFSSMVRIGVFGIVPVEFCRHGPGWTILLYFVGFFAPLAFYAVIVGRSIQSG